MGQERDGRIKSLPMDDRPREKLAAKGADSLTDAELLAILLRTGKKGRNVIEVARDLLEEYDNLAMLAGKSLTAITKVNGIGKDKGVTLMAAFEISRRIGLRARNFSDCQISSPSEVGDIFVPILRDEEKEKFIVVCLNTANKIIKYSVISVGSLDTSIVHPREVFKNAIENNAKSIILVHNHPSGNTDPSSADISITQKLVEVGKIMQIPVLDHIIVGGNEYSSMLMKKLI
ncbi:MAG TPA: DNA repair protein RadC [Ignavibacteriaceae bacterium]|nr:DNA repair protein RadC [Ignavibacteriaceae bacterium]